MTMKPTVLLPGSPVELVLPVLVPVLLPGSPGSPVLVLALDGEGSSDVGGPAGNVQAINVERTTIDAFFMKASNQPKETIATNIAVRLGCRGGEGGAN
jgi:hypothetical protein